MRDASEGSIVVNKQKDDASDNRGGQGSSEDEDSGSEREMDHRRMRRGSSNMTDRSHPESGGLAQGQSGP
eukprot:1307673-Prymnesium_polylepis.1